MSNLLGQHSGIKVLGTYRQMSDSKIIVTGTI